MLEPRLTRNVSGTPAAGCEPASTRAIATRWPFTIFVPTPAIRASGLVTVIDATAETPVAEAVSVPFPARVDAVKTIEVPAVEERRPSALDESVHAGDAATGLPYASEPEAVN